LAAWLKANKNDKMNHFNHHHHHHHVREGLGMFPVPKSSR
jgi:hypothetical protein